MIPAVLWVAWGQVCWLASVAKALGGLAWLVRLAAGAAAAFAGREGERCETARKGC